MSNLRHKLFLLTILFIILMSVVLFRASLSAPDLGALGESPHDQYQWTEENVNIFYSGMTIGFTLNMIIVMFIVFIRRNRIARIDFDNDKKREQGRAHILNQVNGLVERYNQTEKASRNSRERSESLLLAEKN